MNQIIIEDGSILVEPIYIPTPYAKKVDAVIVGNQVHLIFSQKVVGADMRIEDHVVVKVAVDLDFMQDNMSRVTSVVMREMERRADQYVYVKTRDGQTM